jgi:hypothetical protein
VPFVLVSIRYWPMLPFFDRPGGQVAQAGHQVATCMSIVSVCGSGVGGSAPRVCQIVAVLPSSTLTAAPFCRAVSCAVGATGPAGPRQRRVGAAEQVDLRGADHVPRSPASVTAVSRTYRVTPWRT